VAAPPQPQPPTHLHSFDGYTAELEQNQPRYLYLKSDIAGYYGLLTKDVELFTVDLSNPQDDSLEVSTTSTTTPGRPLSSRKNNGDESPRLASVEVDHHGDHPPPPPSQPSTSHSSNNIFAKHIQVLKYLQSRSWSLHEGDSQWAPNECAWYCRTCYSQFSLFQRKHHCRRCGEVFCDDHAPKVDLVSCLPNHFRDVCPISIS
jgi:hypothetical protein